jgi:hypothetical protein
MPLPRRRKRRAWLLYFVALVVVIVVARCKPRAADCVLVADWTAGDVHRYELLTLSSDQTGRWEVNSYDDGIERQRKRFRWTATASSLTVTADGAQRRVPYSIERVGQRCRLEAKYPLPGSAESTWYTGGL